jgi:hypothetical protein
MAEIPDFVRADVTDATLRRYLEDPAFRHDLLANPGDTNERDTLGLSQRTVDWIDERVRHHGIDNLLSGPVTGMVAN